MKDFITLGRYREIAVDPNEIVSVEAVARLDVRGKPKLPPMYDPPEFGGSMIRFRHGGELLVPQGVDEVVSLAIQAAR